MTLVSSEGESRPISEYHCHWSQQCQTGQELLQDSLWLVSYNLELKLKLNYYSHPEYHPWVWNSISDTVWHKSSNLTLLILTSCITELPPGVSQFFKHTFSYMIKMQFCVFLYISRVNYPYSYSYTMGNYDAFIWICTKLTLVFEMTLKYVVFFLDA